MRYVSALLLASAVTAFAQGPPSFHGLYLGMSARSLDSLVRVTAWAYSAPYPAWVTDAPLDTLRAPVVALLQTAPPSDSDRAIMARPLLDSLAWFATDPQYGDTAAVLVQGVAVRFVGAVEPAVALIRLNIAERTAMAMDGYDSRKLIGAATAARKALARLYGRPFTEPVERVAWADIKDAINGVYQGLYTVTYETVLATWHVGQSPTEYSSHGATIPSGPRYVVVLSLQAVAADGVIVRIVVTMIDVRRFRNRAGRDPGRWAD